MQIESYLPADILKPFVKTFLIIESKNGMENRILPDTSIVMAFRCAGKVTYAEDGVESSMPAWGITGIRKSSRLLSYAEKTATLLVIFKEGGAASFFNEPLHELFDLSLSLDHFIPFSILQEIEERLGEAKDNSQKIAIIERFLISRLMQPSPDLLILNAVKKIRSANGDIRIKDLVAGMYISTDPFEKRFRRVVGTSPKQFSSIVRLRNLISHHPKATSFTDTAHAAGYFDQAHFIKDFRSFTGQTPQDFFKSPAYW